MEGANLICFCTLSPFIEKRRKERKFERAAFAVEPGGRGGRGPGLTITILHRPFSTFFESMCHRRLRKGKNKHLSEKSACCQQSRHTVARAGEKSAENIRANKLIAMPGGLIETSFLTYTTHLEKNTFL